MRLIRSKKYIVFIIAVLVAVVTIILLYYNGLIGSTAQIPEIVFTCTKYDEQQEVCEFTFIDKYGKCYYSDDSFVCKGLEGKVNKINAYKAGKINDKIKLCGSCNKNEVIKGYRKLNRIVKKGDIRDIIAIPYGGLTGEKSLPRWDWEWLYFDESGELQCVTLHSNHPGYEDKTNNKQANRIYEWCKDIMGEVED